MKYTTTIRRDAGLFLDVITWLFLIVQNGAKAMGDRRFELIEGSQFQKMFDEEYVPSNLLKV